MIDDEKFKVELIPFNKMSKEMKEKISAYGDENTNYLIIWHNDKIILSMNDQMEPEDATFFRDLDWIKSFLEMMYRIGCEDGVSMLHHAIIEELEETVNK